MVKIRVNKKVVGSIVHGSVFRQSPFTWEPTAFVIESDQLENKIVPVAKQEDSLTDFLANPKLPMVYVIAGTPDDARARYFAAWLVQKHIETGNTLWGDVIWESIYGGYENPLLKLDHAPSMLVISNLADNSTNIKFEKVRDLVEKFPTIPRLIVCAGEDPVSFALTKLRLAAHGIAYFSKSGVKKVQEVY